MYLLSSSGWLSKTKIILREWPAHVFTFTHKCPLLCFLSTPPCCFKLSWRKFLYWHLFLGTDLLPCLFLFKILTIIIFLNGAYLDTFWHILKRSNYPLHSCKPSNSTSVVLFYPLLASFQSVVCMSWDLISNNQSHHFGICSAFWGLPYAHIVFSSLRCSLFYLCTFYCNATIST